LAIKRTEYKIFTGLSQGLVKVLKNPEAQHQGEIMTNTPSLESVSEGDGDGPPTPSDDRRGTTDAKEEIPPSIKSTSADQGTPSKGT
jgi:hypothetical protein